MYALGAVKRLLHSAHRAAILALLVGPLATGSCDGGVDEPEQRSHTVLGDATADVSALDGADDTSQDTSSTGGVSGSAALDGADDTSQDTSAAGGLSGAAGASGPDAADDAPDGNADGGSSCLVDIDGDGYPPVAGCGALAADCNDLDLSVFPGASEVCDGKDNDCDGVVDNVPGATGYWADCDWDGYATLTAQHVESCQWPTILPSICPTGHWTLHQPSADSYDCDDNDLVQSPAGYDDCQVNIDGKDNDCDGVVDGHRWYPDCDGDQFAMQGAAAFSTDSCAKPAQPASACNGSGGWIRAENDGLRVDCDDTNALVNAWAGFHTSPDPVWGWDYTCDGQVQKQYVATAVSSSDACYPWASYGCGGVDGWTGTNIPDCGQAADFSDCGCSTTGNSDTSACSKWGCYCSPCGRTQSLQTQGCR